MAFPSVRSTSSGSIAANGTSTTVTLPATVVSGDILFVLFVSDNGSNSITWDQSSEGTWTQQFESNPTSVDHVTQGWAKVADGTEDSGTLAITHASEQTAWICYCIQDTVGALSGIEVSTVAVGTDNDPNATSLTASWGAEDNLWISLFGCDGAPGMGASLTAWPFADNQIYNHPNNGGGDVDCAICSEESATATNDAGAFTGVDATGDDWSAYTIAVRPASASIIPQIMHHRQQQGNY